MKYGETKVIEMLIDSAENAKSEMVKLTARIALARCLGLQKDVVEVEHGMNIIIRSWGQVAAAEPVPGGVRPALIHQAGKKLSPKWFQSSNNCSSAQGSLMSDMAWPNKAGSDGENKWNGLKN